MPGSKEPEKYHLYIVFEDESFLTVTTQLWGAIELYEKGKERDRRYVGDMRPTPVEPEFTFEYFGDLLASTELEKKRSAKGLLTEDQIIPGLGNAIPQDILFRARLHPRHPIADLTALMEPGILAAATSLRMPSGRPSWKLQAQDSKPVLSVRHIGVGVGNVDAPDETWSLELAGQLRVRRV